MGGDDYEALGDSVTIPDGGDVAGSGDVRSVRVKGEFIRSYIGAGVLPLSPLTAAALPDM